ncbi:hypothetical protein C7M84_013756 [Penaeus vannamei]|uniref:Uncharacterized protein n=1 Tax=Penaeus vannamei TaxID=6689 RepID=A0A3R7PEB1_PENVA|nr:hypothetical protein C7M84_013756 [Penaeus vannamei]
MGTPFALSWSAGALPCILAAVNFNQMYSLMQVDYGVKKNKVYLTFENLPRSPQHLVSVLCPSLLPAQHLVSALSPQSLQHLVLCLSLSPPGTCSLLCPLQSLHHLVSGFCPLSPPHLASALSSVPPAPGPLPLSHHPCQHCSACSVPQSLSTWSLLCPLSPCSTWSLLCPQSFQHLSLCCLSRLSPVLQQPALCSVPQSSGLLLCPLKSLQHLVSCSVPQSLQHWSLLCPSVPPQHLVSALSPSVPGSTGLCSVPQSSSSLVCSLCPPQSLQHLALLCSPLWSPQSLPAGLCSVCLSPCSTWSSCLLCPSVLPAPGLLLCPPQSLQQPGLCSVLSPLQHLVLCLSPQSLQHLVSALSPHVPAAPGLLLLSSVPQHWFSALVPSSPPAAPGSRCSVPSACTQPWSLLCSFSCPCAATEPLL